MSTREYIGARYVPLFADPIEWDSSKTYEPLTVVYHQGNSYTSRQAVPAGINIDNETYWALTGNYNAQIEQYRSEVATFDGRIESLENSFPIKTSSIADEVVTSAKIADGAITPSKLSITTRYAPNVILIGDSWGAGWTPDGNVTSWIERVTDYLKSAGRDVYSSAVGGAGIVAGTNYNSQLSSLAETLTSKQKYSVGKIVCAGGWNDNSNSLTASYDNALKSLKATCTSNFPNAELVIVWFGNGNYEVSNIHTQILRMKAASEAAFNACRNNSISFVNAINLLSGIVDWASDGYHPLNYAQSFLAMFIINLFEGATTTYLPYSGSVNLLLNGNNSGAFITTSGYLYTVGTFETPSFYIRGTAQINNTTTTTFNGNSPIVTLYLDSAHATNKFINTHGAYTTPAILKIDGKYYTTTLYAHLVQSTSSIAYSFYCFVLNDEHTNYLTGTLQTIEFIG